MTQPSRDEQFDDIIEKLNSSSNTFCKNGSGEDWEKEDVANHILAVSRRGITKHSDLREVLSVSQLDLRRGREVYTTQGFPEKYLFQGLYRRAYNPNSRGSHSSNASPNLENDTEHYYGGE